MSNDVRFKVLEAGRQLSTALALAEDPDLIQSLTHIVEELAELKEQVKLLYPLDPD